MHRRTLIYALLRFKKLFGVDEERLKLYQLGKWGHKAEMLNPAPDHSVNGRRRNAPWDRVQGDRAMSGTTMATERPVRPSCSSS